MVVKIADFGLARDIYDKQYYRSKKQRPLPIRWMAPECLQSDCVFSSKTDVVSYTARIHGSWIKLQCEGVDSIRLISKRDICRKANG